MPELICVQSLHEPHLEGYRVLGVVTSIYHRWSEYVLEHIELKVRKPRAQRLPGGKVRARRGN